MAKVWKLHKVLGQFSLRNRSHNDSLYFVLQEERKDLLTQLVILAAFAMKFYTEDGNWDLVGNNTPIFFIRDPMLVSGKDIFAPWLSLSCPPTKY